MTEIVRLNSSEAEKAVDELSTLLQDAVDGGASVGFLPPLSKAEATAFWKKVIELVAEGNQVLLVAKADGVIAGTVQLELASKSNGSHRAEVQKLLVHRRFRNRGIARTLMQEIETIAQQYGRSLIVLDTRTGDTAEQLYQKLGYVQVGIIPRFSRNADSTLDGSTFFYKEL